MLGIPAGRLEVGQVFDAIAAACAAGEPGVGVAVWDLDDWTRVFEKIVRLATPTLIANVWVNGKWVNSTAAKSARRRVTANKRANKLPVRKGCPGRDSNPHGLSARGV